MNTITIELCTEDRARLDAILTALESRPSCERCAETVAEMYTDATQAAVFAVDEKPAAVSQDDIQGGGGKWRAITPSSCSAQRGNRSW